MQKGRIKSIVCVLVENIIIKEDTTTNRPSLYIQKQDIFKAFNQVN